MEDEGRIGRVRERGGVGVVPRMIGREGVVELVEGVLWLRGICCRFSSSLGGFWPRFRRGFGGARVR